MLRLLLILTALIVPAVLCAGEQRDDWERLFDPVGGLQVEAPTRSLRPISRAAENIEVITSADIERMHAHTLADVLMDVTGVQLYLSGGPGSPAPVHLLGSEQRHVTIMVDGVQLNNPEGIVDAASFPVQHIKRIEIIKGPASSSWGSALGGIINIVTKRAERPGGALGASYGERNTSHQWADYAVRSSDTELYLMAGHLRTNGFRPQNEHEGDHLFMALSHELRPDLKVAFTAGHDTGDQGLFERPGMFAQSNTRRTFATLTADYHVRSAIISASLRAHGQSFDNYISATDGTPLASTYADDAAYGGSVKAQFVTGIHQAVVGIDYDTHTLKATALTDNRHSQRRWAIYVNDTLDIGRLSITPGLRYDDTGTNGSAISPSIGATYRASQYLLLRASVARGFSTPSMLYTFSAGRIQANPDLKTEKVWSYQAGAELALKNIAWIKLTTFRHDVHDALDYEPAAAPGTLHYVNRLRQRRQGGELEIVTAKMENLTVSAGASFVDARDLDTDQVLKAMPRYAYRAGVAYDAPGFRADLTGRYIWWNAESAFGGRYSAMIADLSVTQKVADRWEIYLNVHNAFNGAQYLVSMLQTPGRWMETGVTYRF